MDYKELAEQIVAAIENNKSVARLYDLARDGGATFADADELAKEIGETFKATFGEMLTPEQLDEATLGAVKRLINRGAIVTQEYCDIVQGDLNLLSDTGLQSVVPNVDTERINGIIENARGITMQEQIASMLGDNAVDFLMSVVDAWVKANAEFQASIGMEPIIVRKWIGVFGTHDTKRTDYCHTLAGRYQYGTEPKKVYQRHKGCRCTVTYYPDRKAEPRITALRKGDKDTQQVLWNTGKYSSTSRNRHRRRNDGVKAAIDKING